MIFKSDSSSKTRDIGKFFAQNLTKGDIVCLKGDLGAGKTEFAKGIGSFWGIEDKKILSPTFTLLNIYKNEKIIIYHFDWYRLKSKRELYNIGAEEYIFGTGISIIEWYNFEYMHIENIKEVELKFIDENTREINFL